MVAQSNPGFGGQDLPLEERRPSQEEETNSSREEEPIYSEIPDLAHTYENSEAAVSSNSHYQQPDNVERTLTSFYASLYDNPARPRCANANIQSKV